MNDIELFSEAIRSKFTARQYIYILSKFKIDTGITDLRKIKSKELERTLIEYVIKLKKRGVGYSRQNPETVIELHK